MRGDATSEHDAANDSSLADASLDAGAADAAMEGGDASMAPFDADLPSCDAALPPNPEAGTCTLAFDPSPSPVCISGQPCPVVASAFANCYPNDTIGVAAGPGDAGYLTFNDQTGTPTFVTLDPASGITQTNPFGMAADVSLASTSTGTPAAIGRTLDSAGTAYTLTYFTPPADGGAWNQEVLSVPQPGSYELRFDSNDCAFAGFVDSTMLGLYLSVRTGPGIWTTNQLAAPSNFGGYMVGTFSTAADISGHSYVANYTPSADTSGLPPELAYYVSGAARTPVDPSFTTPPFFPNFHIATLGVYDPPVFLFTISTDLRLLIPTGSGYTTYSFTNSGAAYNGPPACPVDDAVCQSECPCAQVACTACQAQLTGTLDGALARASDGSVWVAYISRTVDQDLFAIPQCAAPICGCVAEVTADRSSNQIVLAQIAPDGSAVTERWRGALPSFYHGNLAMAVSGTHVYLAYSGGNGVDEEQLGYILVDTSTL